MGLEVRAEKKREVKGSELYDIYLNEYETIRKKQVQMIIK